MALEIFLVLIVSVMLVSLISSASLPCQNCTAQHIRITKDAPGKCDVCWPCSSLECHEGQGPSFACGATVYHGSQIHCVACAPGKNFSDSVGSKQCQPCGVCAGEHERVLAECTAESDVRCECEDGFYRNGTTKDCLPCSSCCTENGNIKEKCKGDGGGIGTKCKFKELQPSTCLSSSTAPKTTVSIPVQKPYSPLITSSFIFVTSSFLHATPTPLLDSITPTAPATSETVFVKARLINDRYSKIQGVSGTVNVAKPSEETKTAYHIPKALEIALWLFLVMACAICVVKTFRSRAYLLGAIKRRLGMSQGQPIRSNDLELQARECEIGQNSSSHSGVSEPLLDNEPATDATSSSLTTTVVACKTADSSDSNNLVLSINLPEENRTDTKLEKGIPSSLDNGPAHQGQQLRKRLASEGDDETEPCLEEIHVTNQEASCSLSAEPVPIQATEDNRDYSTHITDLPESVIWEVCMLLDVERCIDHKDYTMLASDFLGLTPQQARTLKELKQRNKSPSYHLLMEVFSSKKNSGTLKYLCCILEHMERYDVIKVIDDWVLKKPNKLKEAPV